MRKQNEGNQGLMQGRIRVGVQGMRWECGCGKSALECSDMGKNAKNVGNQGANAGNQGGNLSIAVEMTLNSNGHDKFKEWRELKTIENKCISKSLVSHI